MAEAKPEKGEEQVVPDDKKPERSKVVTVEFSDLFKAKRVPDARGIIYISPIEAGVDYEELGLNPNDQFGYVYRPFKPGENADVREAVKDFSDEERLQEYYDEICMRCLVKPAFPDNADGRKTLHRHLPGTRQTIAQAVIEQSGMGLHQIKSAREELGKLSAMTTNTVSSSG